MTRHADLIAKLEAAPEGSRELDLEITKAVGWCAKSAWYDSEGDCLQWHEYHDFGSTTAAELLSDPLHHFTTSLDAALTLVPEGAQYCLGCLSDTRVSVRGVSRYHAWVMEQETVYAPTPALALCIAALKVRAAEESDT